MLQSALGDHAGVVLSAGYAAAMTQASAIKTLGEIALRVNDLPRMKRFYAETLGLRVLGESSTAVFFAVAPGHAGHTQVLVLFARGIEVSAERSTVDHIAFTIDLEGYDSERQRLTALGLSVEVAQHDALARRQIDNPEIPNHLRIGVTEDRQ